MEFRADPYPYYARLRAEGAAVYSDAARMWVVPRYEDVLHVLKEAERFSSDAMASMLALGRSGAARANAGGEPLMPGVLVTYDPPEHTRLRTIVNRAFTPRRIESWRPMVERVARQCIEEISRRERFDAIADVAALVPVRVVAEILGIDADRHADFKRWADTLSAAMTGSKRDMDPVESGAARAGIELAQHLAQVVAQRMAEPGHDVISTLIAAQEAEILTPPEVIGFAGVLTFAGSETTANLIGNAVRILALDASVRERVFAEPRIVPNLLEETLRWDSPVQYVFRRATRPTKIAGIAVEKDEILCALVGSANRDPDRWGTDAEEFRVDRTAGGQLGFGLGAHFCLGAALARLEADCVLRHLLPLLEESRFAGHELTPIDSVQFRGVSRLEFVRA
jgi:cytochrome P450